MGKGRTTSLLRLIVPSSFSTRKNATQEEVVTGKDDIHDHIIAYNIKHYSKAESSPLGINTPLYHKLGPAGITQFSDDVLHEKLQIQDLEEIHMKETVELLHSIIKPGLDKAQNHITTPPEIDISLEPKDFSSIFSTWKETTTISPSGRHLGHYKSILNCPELVSFHCIMTSLPLCFGFAPSCWTKAIQIMLEKKPGIPLLNRLRVIIILEANYNWALRLIWGKRLFQSAAQSNLLMPAQQARPGFHSITAALNKFLAYDLMRLTKRDGGSFNNDAEGCYDRIVTPPPRPTLLPPDGAS